jgi:hypothetical protein
MALPVLEKTWEIDANNAIAAVDKYTDNRTLMLAIVNALIGFVNVPCTVWGSCDSINVSNSGINYWTDFTKLVWSGSGAHSWIVINFPGVGTKTAICFDLSQQNSSSESATVYLSPDNGFGLTNGGTDGTTSARPTATDEITLTTSNVWGGVNNSIAQKLHLWHSTDGECTRVAVARNGYLPLFFMIEKAKELLSGWSGIVATWTANQSNVSNQATYDNYFNSQAIYKIRHLGVNYNLYPSVERCWAINSYNMNSFFTIPMDQINQWPIFQNLSLWGSTYPIRTRFGNLYDHFYGGIGAVLGDSYPSGGTYQFWQVGAIVLPGDGNPLQVS